MGIYSHPVSHGEAGCCHSANPLSGVVARCPRSPPIGNPIGGVRARALPLGHGRAGGPATKRGSNQGSCRQAGFEPGRSGLGTARPALDRGGLARNGLCANRRAGKGPLLAGNRTYAHFGPRAPVRPPSPSPLATRFALPSCPIPPKNKTYFGCKAERARPMPVSLRPHPRSDPVRRQSARLEVRIWFVRRQFALETGGRIGT